MTITTSELIPPPGADIDAFFDDLVWRGRLDCATAERLADAARAAARPGAESARPERSAPAHG